MSARKDKSAISSMTTTGLKQITTSVATDTSQVAKALDAYVDSRVGSEWLPINVDTCLGYTAKIRDAGKDPTMIETFVKQRAFSAWRQDMADEVHAMTKQL